MTFLIVVVIGLAVVLAGTLGLGAETCPRGQQRLHPGEPCIPDALVNYLYCLEKSGGGRVEVEQHTANDSSRKLEVKVNGKGSGVVLKGQGAGALTKEDSQKIAETVHQKLDPTLAARCERLITAIAKPTASAPVPKPKPAPAEGPRAATKAPDAMKPVTLQLEQIVFKEDLDASDRKVKTVVVQTDSGHPNGAHRVKDTGPQTAEPGYRFVRQYRPGRSDFLLSCQGRDQSCQFFAQPIVCPLAQGDTVVNCVSVTSSHSLTLTYEFPMLRVVKVRERIPDREVVFSPGVATRVTFREGASRVRIYGTLPAGTPVDVSLAPRLGGDQELLRCTEPIPAGNREQESSCRLAPPKS